MEIISGFANHINEALFDPSPQDSILRIKNAVAHEITALDATAEIKSTDYFNHTFAPDFVLTWPDQVERRVYLRLAYDLEALAAGMDFIDTHAPLVLGLNSREAVEAKSLVDESIAGTNVMFTEPAAMERLIQHKETEATANLFSNAIAQGGRGTFVADDAVQLSDVVELGFEGAAAIERQPTEEALSVISTYLGDIQASRMTRVLQAVWEGSGGSLTDFPGHADLSGRLTPEALHYLVKYMRTDDIGFWQRIGRKLQLSDLETLDFDADSDNIQLLIKANLDVIRARAAVVRKDPLGVNSLEIDQKFRWSRRGQHVTFEAPNLYAALSSSKTEIEDFARESANAVPIEDFIERSGEFQLVECTLEASPETVTAKTAVGTIAPDRLRKLADSVEGSGAVTEATFATPSGRVTTNLTRQTGSGVTKSNLLMADLLATTLPIVSELDLTVRSEMLAFLSYDEIPGQLTLDLGEFQPEFKLLPKDEQTRYRTETSFVVYEQGTLVQPEELGGGHSV